MPTIKDVARVAGVSTATVSAVINDSAYVSPGLKARVLQAVETLDYAPSGVARNLKSGRSRLLALIVADLSNPFFGSLVNAAEAAASACGYSLAVFNSDERVETEKGICARINDLGCDGVILAPSGNSGDYERRERLRIGGRPLVMLDRAVQSLTTDSVTLDNRAAGWQAANYLMDLGHSAIGSVTGPLHVTTGLGRYEGLIAAMQMRGIRPNQAFFGCGEFREDVAYSVAKSLLGRADRPTALYVANGAMLVGTWRAVSDLGLDCPSDISIVSTDHWPGFGAWRPRMTRTEQPVTEMANEAVRLLMERIERGHDAPPRHLVFQPTLIVRESCAPLGAARSEIAAGADRRTNRAR